MYFLQLDFASSKDYANPDSHSHSFATPFHVFSKTSRFSERLSVWSPERCECAGDLTTGSDWLIAASQGFDDDPRAWRATETDAADEDDGNSFSRKVCHSLRDEMKLREEGRMIVFFLNVITRFEIPPYVRTTIVTFVIRVLCELHCMRSERFGRRLKSVEGNVCEKKRKKNLTRT